VLQLLETFHSICVFSYFLPSSLQTFYIHFIEFIVYLICKGLCFSINIIVRLIYIFFIIVLYFCGISLFHSIACVIWYNLVVLCFYVSVYLSWDCSHSWQTCILQYNTQWAGEPRWYHRWFVGNIQKIDLSLNTWQR
jgi:hypothetical protein